VSERIWQRPQLTVTFPDEAVLDNLARSQATSLNGHR
jgi:hypothetical protein